jgi:hypothetical protein
MDIPNVWRLEVSIKHGNAFMFDGMVLDLETIAYNRAQVFRSLMSSSFQIHKNEGHKDKTNDTQVQLLDLNPGITTFRSTPAKKMAEHNGRIALLRQLVKALDDEQVLLDAESRHGVLNHIAQIIKRDGLQHYFCAMVGNTFEEFRDEIEIFASQRWAVRDSIAVPLDEEKGSQPTAGRLYDIPKPTANADIPANNKFDDEQSANYEDWRHWFMSQIRTKPKEPPKDSQLNFDFNK